MSDSLFLGFVTMPKMDSQQVLSDSELEDGTYCIAEWVIQSHAVVPNQVESMSTQVCCCF